MSESTLKLPTMALGLLVALLMGCATVAQPTPPPRVSLASIRVEEIRGFETALTVDLRILNPSDQPLKIHGLDCILMLNDRQLAQGVSKPQKEIAPYTSSIVSVRVYSSMLDMVGVAHRILYGVRQETPAEKISYEISGHILAGGSGFNHRVPFESKGEIDFQSLAGTP